MSQFSIVIPVKKGKYFLEKCIASLQNQTIQDFNVLVLTDPAANEDGILDWLRSLQMNNLKIIHSDKELNIQENWSRIMAIEKSEFFTILGYDDILYPGYLETMQDLIDRYPDASLYQTHFDFINDKDEKTGAAPVMKRTSGGTDFFKSLLTAEYFIMATGYMIRTADYEKVGGMPVHYPNLLYADYELWLRLTFLSYQAVSPETCFAFRIHQSTTHRSPVRVMLSAFENLVDYLEVLGEAKYGEVIREHGAYFLKYNCNAMAYRLIRKPLHLREGLKVKDLLSTFDEFARRLKVKDPELEAVRNIRIAKFIDGNMLTRKFYLIFRRFFSKPVLRSSFNRNEGFLH